MAIDRNGNSHKAAGRPDGGQFDHKAGRASDDDLDFEAADGRLAEAMPDMDADSRRRLIGAVTGGGDLFAANGLDGLPEGARTMARIMAARGGDGIYRDLAKYNKEMGWADAKDAPSAPAAPSPFANVTLAPETLRSLVSGGMTDFHGADLHGLDLTGYDLKGLNLDGVDFDDAILDGADFESSSIRGATFRNASLDDCSMEDVRADGAVFDGAAGDGWTFRPDDPDGAAVSCRGMRLKGAEMHAEGTALDLSDAQVDESNVEMGGGSSLRHARFDSPGDLVANMVGEVDCTGLEVAGVTSVNQYGEEEPCLCQADLTDARFAPGVKAVFGGSTFRGADLRGTEVFDAGGNDYAGADLRDARIYLRGASNRDGDSRLAGADVRGATIAVNLEYDNEAVDFRGVDLTGLKWASVTDGPMTNIRTDRDPEGREVFNPASYGMVTIGDYTDVFDGDVDW